LQRGAAKCYHYIWLQSLFIAIKPLRKLLRCLGSLESGFQDKEFIALFVTNYGDLLKRVADSIKRRLTCTACKRLMLLIALRVAREFGAKAIVTGELLGEGASQTLDNLYVISKSIEMPVLRPLIGFDKEGVTSMARFLGFEEAMVGLPPCAALPKSPETHADASALDVYEELLEKLSQEAVWEAKSIE